MINLKEFLQSPLWIISTTLGLPVLGYLIRWLQDWLGPKIKNRYTEEFFGKNKLKTYIIHSVTDDQDRRARSYPAVDMQVVRIVSRILKSLGKVEDKNYFVMDSKEFLASHSGSENPWECNLICICGPILNRVTRMIYEEKKPKGLRYTMGITETVDKRLVNIIRDEAMKTALQSSWETPESISNKLIGKYDNDGYDMGVVQSFINPLNDRSRVVMIAGIHGAGTLGASLALRDRRVFKRLAGKKDQARNMEQAYRVTFHEGPLNITQYDPL